MMCSLSAEEALKVSESFLITLYTYDIYERWSRLKKRMNFLSEKEFVIWMIDCIESHGFDQHPVRIGSVVAVSNAPASSYNAISGIPGLKANASSGYRPTAAADLLHQTLFTTTQQSGQEQYIPLVGSNEQVTNKKVAGASTFPYHVTAPLLSMSQPTNYSVSNADNVPDICTSYHDVGLGASAQGDTTPVETMLDTGDLILHQAGTSKLHRNCGPNPLKQMRFICPHCSKRFRYKHVMQRHITALHLNIKKHACSQCDSVFARVDHLNAHISSVHERNKPYSCDICLKEFSQQSGLDSHIRIIHENIRKEKLELCEHCAYACSNPVDLRRHCVAKHNYKSEHQCHKCNKYFSQQNRLVRHVSNCQGVKRRTDSGEVKKGAKVKRRRGRPRKNGRQQKCRKSRVIISSDESSIDNDLYEITEKSTAVYETDSIHEDVAYEGDGDELQNVTCE